MKDETTESRPMLHLIFCICVTIYTVFVDVFFWDIEMEPIKI